MSDGAQSPDVLSLRPDRSRATALPRSRPRLRLRRLLVDLLVYVGLTIGMVAVILPFLYMVASSLETIAQIGSLTPQFWPDPPQWSNYQQVLQQLPVAQYFVNSLIVAAAVTGGQIITASMAAYAFARL